MKITKVFEDDPLFYKLRAQNPGWGFCALTYWLPEVQSVISYFLPFSDQVRQSNYCEGLPADECLYGRFEGEACNEAIRIHLAEKVKKLGGEAVIPILDPRFSIVDKQSNWSERHVAFIAGLGTFGLHKSIITKRGCAGRFGSIVTSLKILPTIREYEYLEEYCTGCGQCIDRCPCFAITSTGMNIWKCSSYLDQMKEKFAPRYGCGKCQTLVPCERNQPV